jgi:hypothetical protein
LVLVATRKETSRRKTSIIFIAIRVLVGSGNCNHPDYYWKDALGWRWPCGASAPSVVGIQMGTQSASSYANNRQIPNNSLAIYNKVADRNDRFRKTKNGWNNFDRSVL